MHIRICQATTKQKMPSPKSRHIARGKPHIIRYKGIVSDGLGNRILDFGFWNNCCFGEIGK